MFRFSFTIAASLLSCSACFPAFSQSTGNWPQWRGPAGTGVAVDANPPTDWSETKNIRWKTSVPGRGHSTPIVWGDKVFLTTAIPVGPKLPPKPSGRPGAHDNLPVDSEYRFVVLAFDRDDGQLIWDKMVRQAVPIEGAHHTASLASASPVTDGTHVFAHFGTQGLYCLDFDGKVVWSKQLGTMHTKHGHGEGSSPALYGDTLIVNWDHEEQSFLVAIDKTTGTQLWRRDRDEVTSWSTPIIVELDGTTQVIVCGTDRVRGYDITSGETIWQCGGLSANIVATPVAADSILYVGSSYEKRAMMAIQLSDARGDITDSDQVLWMRTRGTPYVPSPLLYDDSLYYLTHYQNVMTRIEAKTGVDAPGALRLGPLGNIYASPVGAAGRVYVTDLDGVTLVLSHSQIPRMIAVNRLGEKVSASAAIVGEEIFLRGDKHLFCISN
ncbi:PQQ-binding-like beta-propeller repeat protein [Roseimaritima ulvae]|uniref:Outer membrane biogenesis protein BamB n=1 Tax=Roseimaritima ulvae TaxID=980254 RepID=A0A5B9QVX9_9BACT|nr:PQQ-binding-like beta-propeller repeat protein [Roseimaritima ulvae]QEG42059.1 outer membrane biogenesis protein BamB [Roseimaritima ulvae]